jgi:prepilin-type N-terminal cleavage/methylation domain-containing protein
MNSRGFTLIELLVVIAIIAFLASVALPAIGPMIERGRSAKCVANLRQIGAAVQQYVADNDYRFPAIETEPPSLPPEVEDPGTALEKLGPYGITKQVLTCPSDAAKNKNYVKHGTSYHFSPVLQDETPASVKIYSRRGTFQISNIGRLTVASDIEAVHATGRNYGLNVLKADGRVEQR